MGFDIECIIDIQTYPGEYFCPVCRTLVYPNEAFQSQCSHLYCKPCLAHIANGSKACPYDGYLVTESDSKPLIDSDRSLAEKIGKVKVHCLFFRSGCTWEGTLSDCTSHRSECSFGSSAVICNRCGIQIVHRQVHDHAQSCTGVYEAKQATVGVPGATSSGTALSAPIATVNLTIAQSGQSLSQPQNSQNVAVSLQPGQNPTQQPIANPQAVSVQTMEQWYQQQYQQYYQQYTGYDPYQQPHQQYYSLQQNQHNPQHVHGQPQSHAYTQLAAQPQPLQLQPQPQPLPQPQLQSYPVPQNQQQPQFQPLAQGIAQSQPPVLPQIPMQVQVQGQAQLRAPNQTFPPDYQVNPQKQPPHLMRPQAQIPPQILPLPPHSQPNHQLPLGVQAVCMQPAVQYPQLPPYFQPPLQIPHSHASQTHSQLQFLNQTSNQSHLQIQPQASQYQNQYPQVRPLPLNQPTVPAAQPQPPHPPASTVTGHHSYQQPQPAHQMHSGVLDQPPINLHPTSGSLHPVKLHDQVPHQPAVMRPPPSHDSFPPQPLSAFLLPQSQVSSVPPAHQKFSAHAQPSNHLPQHNMVLQPVQQAVPQKISQQQPFVGPVKAQFEQQGHFQQQLQLQPQLHPYGPPPQQSQSYDGKPMMSNEGMHPQNYSQSSSGFGAVVHTVPAQLGSTRPPANLNSAESAVLEEEYFSSKHTNPDARVPGKGLAEKEVLGTDVEPLKEEVISNNKLGPHEMIATRVKDEVSGSAIVKLSGAISIEAKTTEGNASKEESLSVAGSNLPQQVQDLESRKEAVVAGRSTDIEKVSKNPLSRPEAQLKEQPPLTLRPQGLGILLHSRQSLPLAVPTSHTGKAPGYFGPPPGSFETDLREVFGNAPQLHPEGQSGLQNHVRPNEGVMFKHQSSSYLSGSVERVPHRQIYGHEPSVWRATGETDPNFGSREHLNPFPMEPLRPLEQGSMNVDKSQPGSSYGTGGKLNSGLDSNLRLWPPYQASGGQGHADVFGPDPESGRHHVKHFPPRSPGGEHLGISPHEFGGPSRFPRGTTAFDDINAKDVHRFGEGSRSFNLPSDPVGNSFHDSRFPPMPGHPRRGDSDIQHNLRFGEHMTRPLHSHIKSDDAFGKDGPGPVPLGRVDFSGPGYLPGHFMSEAAGRGIFSGNSHAGVCGGRGNFNHRIPFGESIRGDRPNIPPFGEPGIRSNYPLQGFPNPGGFVGEVGSFDQSRKRKPISMGWCRICMFDCETVEGLEMHSQTMEHQKMAMDMVKTIKQRNKKKQRTSSGHMGYDGGSRSKTVGTDGRGNKP